MSKQLRLSALVSVLTMALFVVAGAPAVADHSGAGTPLLDLQVHAPAVPAAGNLLPALR